MQVASTHQLPTLAELHQEDLFKHDALLELLNKPVHQSWVKTHNTVTVKSGNQTVPLKYLPIDKVRFLLTRIFGLYWWDEIVSYKDVFNSIAVQVRLHYCIPGTNTWLHKDGAGAVNVQLNSGAQGGNLSEIKAAAVMMAFPSAASYALSNAAEKLGTLFGGGLNKSDIQEFVGSRYRELATAQGPSEPPKQVLQSDIEQLLEQERLKAALGSVQLEQPPITDVSALPQMNTQEVVAAFLQTGKLVAAGTPTQIQQINQAPANAAVASALNYPGNMQMQQGDDEIPWGTAPATTLLQQQSVGRIERTPTPAIQANIFSPLNDVEL
jgi:hypothetical protein